MISDLREHELSLLAGHMTGIPSYITNHLQHHFVCLLCSFFARLDKPLAEKERPAYLQWTEAPISGQECIATQTRSKFIEKFIDIIVAAD